jgi:hypothetical protein
MDIIEASRKGNLSRVRELIAQGAINYAEPGSGYTSLIIFTSLGNLPMVQELLAHGANVNVYDINTYTALMYATKINNLQIIQELISHGADVNSRDEYGYTALMFAAAESTLPIVKQLIASRADVNARDNFGSTPLRRALINHISILQELISSGADVNARDNNGCTVLMIASINSGMPYINELINHGADINARDNKGNTAFMYAQKFNNVSVLYYKQILLKQEIIQKTNEAILADTSVPENINILDSGCDVIERGCLDINKVKIQDFIIENPDNSIIIKFVDSPTHSRHFLYTRDNLIYALQSSVVYPCLEANNLPGRDSNVVTNLPLYSLATIIDVKVLVKKDMLDTLLQNLGNVFIVVNKHVYSYPSIASHDVVFNQGTLVGALHCNAGAEVEKLYTIKRVNVPALVGGFYNKYEKYRQILKLRTPSKGGT